MAGKKDRRRSLQRQAARLDRQLAGLAATSSRYSWARLGIFIAGVVVSGTAFLMGGAWTGLAATAASVIAFGTAAHYHHRVKVGITRHTLWRSITLTHLARMDLDWDSLPPAAIPTPRSDHPLELDLDLIGERSLHRLIDTCASREGSARLRDWLATETPDPLRIRQRQALVRELVRLPVFRDKLRLSAILSSGGRSRRWESARLLGWMAQFAPPAGIDAWRIGLTILAGINIVLFALTALASAPPLWRISLSAYTLAYVWWVLRLGDPFSVALALRDPLHDLQAVFEHLETTRYRDYPALDALRAPFLAPDQRPSAQLARVSRVLSAASVRHNPPFWMLLSLILPWDLYVINWLDRSRAALVDLLPQWLDVWFDLEALSALAALAYLNPEYVFPDLAEPDAPLPVLEARALGHPLIPDQERVCNDFTLAQPGDLAMITGSNMSGKSTFLRTLGVNLCLAYAGGPVAAQQFRTIPLRLFTCIRVTDSVTDGISYFYAEVKRLKQLLNALDADHLFPLLYLIDEIFRGTNNRERLIGSRAYIRALVGQRGVGALSTHDLELIHLADDMAAIHNYHFEEHIADGRMTFDYQLRSGPCPTTNALKIMQMEGLPVEVTE